MNFSVAGIKNEPMVAESTMFFLSLKVYKKDG